MSVENVPGYLAGANSDPLMTVMLVVLVLLVLVIGVLYFKLHAVPDHIAHGKDHTQIQLITVLTLLALFTHNGTLWVAALILAVVKLPDFLTPLRSIAKSLAVLANSEKSSSIVQPTTSTSNESDNKSDNVASTNEVTNSELKHTDTSVITKENN
ncbi:hypothetical protein [Colwellia sp. E2M01]|uniref:hypothetical protein n=1 Tax=Colwellia sp. E2M01 TaxID=2841561 RepID=UPI0020916062|nr:hypothetical protein [Colwellia sp. E2M01]